MTQAYIFLFVPNLSFTVSQFVYNSTVLQETYVEECYNVTDVICQCNVMCNIFWFEVTVNEQE